MFVLIEYWLFDLLVFDGVDWSVMCMLIDLLIINCSLLFCEGKGNIYFWFFFKKRYMYIYRKWNKNMLKSLDLKKIIFIV